MTSWTLDGYLPVRIHFLGSPFSERYFLSGGEGCYKWVGIFFRENHRVGWVEKFQGKVGRGSYDEMWIQQPEFTWVFMARFSW